jgi:hypothetical protein
LVNFANCEGMDPANSLSRRIKLSKSGGCSNNKIKYQ